MAHEMRKASPSASRNAEPATWTLGTNCSTRSRPPSSRRKMPIQGTPRRRPSSGGHVQPQDQTSRPRSPPEPPDSDLASGRPNSSTTSPCLLPSFGLSPADSSDPEALPASAYCAARLRGWTTSPRIDRHRPLALHVAEPEPVGQPPEPPRGPPVPAPEQAHGRGDNQHAQD